MLIHAATTFVRGRHLWSFKKQKIWRCTRDLHACICLKDYTDITAREERGAWGAQVSWCVGRMNSLCPGRAEAAAGGYMLTPGFNRPLASAFAQISDLVMNVVPLRQCCRHKRLTLSQQSTSLDSDLQGFTTSKQNYKQLKTIANSKMLKREG